ncbi:manganese efflux pump MntP family protein [Clostridium cellulovorans]|uniref:Putative manganese efflux pump MntP n=1 Tax=Clostridium cellulovorans (strain ATCC 35296 / DSM 3052 / OCM 3 / 743B) TaxID=573061 RepID=D9SSV3_CLOC7|nr:manganese efflux pump [Clostridium cellulovorans]ADL52615.1 protein of unknown function DUF204 [Clostridium cellulovorans 743B]
MNFFSLTLIAIALALDAFGVALSIGISGCAVKKQKIILALSFGFFQFLFAYIGATLGYFINSYIISVPEIIGGVIQIIIGFLMLWQGYRKGEGNFRIRKDMYAILGASVSIDAMIVGFAVLFYEKNMLIIFEYALYIGLIAMILSLAAFFLSKYLKKISIVEQYAEFIAGVILIFFGLKMILL